MAVYTFSTKDKNRPQDTRLVDDIKQHCEDKRINFSGVVLDLLKQWAEVNDVRRQD